MEVGYDSSPLGRGGGTSGGGGSLTYLGGSVAATFNDPSGVVRPPLSGLGAGVVGGPTSTLMAAVDATMVMGVVRVVGQTTLAVVAIPVSHRHKVYHQHVTRWHYHATKQDQPAAHQKDTKVLLKSKLAYQTRQTTVTLTSDQWQPQDTLKRKCTSETGSKCKTKHHKTPTASVNQDSSSDKKY